MVGELDGVVLEETCNKLDGEYEKSKNRAENVSKRIRDVEKVAKALFREWERKLEEFSDMTPRRKSQQRLESTRRRYGELNLATRRAERTIDPVLAALEDEVFFLERNPQRKGNRSHRKIWTTLLG